MLRHRTSRRSYSEISRKSRNFGLFFGSFLDEIWIQKVIFFVHFSEILGDFCIFSENLEKNAENAKISENLGETDRKKLLFGAKLFRKKIKKKAQNCIFPRNLGDETPRSSIVLEPNVPPYHKGVSIHHGGGVGTYTAQVFIFSWKKIFGDFWN